MTEDLSEIKAALSLDAIADLHKGCTHLDGSAQRCRNLKLVIEAARRWRSIAVPGDPQGMDVKAAHQVVDGAEYDQAALENAWYAKYGDLGIEAVDAWAAIRAGERRPSSHNPSPRAYEVYWPDGGARLVYSEEEARQACRYAGAEMRGLYLGWFANQPKLSTKSDDGSKSIS